MKEPAFRYSETVAFYRDTVGLELIETGPDTTRFVFGALTLWLDPAGTILLLSSSSPAT